MAKDPRLDLQIRTEQDFYGEQSKRLSSIITGFGYLVGVIMAVGAIFAALNTMYSAVTSRTVEIATLRAIGFGGTPVVVSVMIEALLLALLGGVARRSAVVSGVQRPDGVDAEQRVVLAGRIRFRGDAAADSKGSIWAVVLGFVGGLFPAVRAARLPITVALRGE